MVEIRQVKTKLQMRKFVGFPLKLYKDSKFYVPSFFSDEVKLISKKKNVYSEYSDSYFFLAYKDGKIAGRIGAIVNYASIKKTGEKNLRFTRFDVIDDFEVAEALFNTVENLAKDLGLAAVHGPWGYNDLDKEGMLIKGFDYLATYGTLYNYEYYPKFIEKLGYTKECEWLERLLTIRDIDARTKELGMLSLKRYKLKEVAQDDVKLSKLFDKYGQKVFDLLDLCYKDLDGVVPFTENFVKSLLAQLKLVLEAKYISIIVDENDEVVGMGAAVRSFAGALNKCGGKLLPFGVFKILHALKHGELMELLIVGVHPDYQTRGLMAWILNKIQSNMYRDGIRLAETNCTLEDNAPINNIWDKYEHIKHKRRRCYIKKIV